VVRKGNVARVKPAERKHQTPAQNMCYSCRLSNSVVAGVNPAAETATRYTQQVFDCSTSCLQDAHDAVMRSWVVADVKPAAEAATQQMQQVVDSSLRLAGPMMPWSANGM
jgi:hypothetical protein